LTLFKYEDQGVATLEDGLYTLEGNLADAAMTDRLVRFVRATVQGWRRAVADQKEAVDIVLDNDVTGAQTLVHQTFMMKEVAKLVGDDPATIGYLEPAAFERTVDVLLSAVATPVISRRPDGGWTHAVWDRLSTD
jgi:NitT/TauT family transport system substrate-binding protein